MANTTAALRFCAYPGCHLRVPHGYCPTHRREKSTTHRHSQHPEYNKARWQAYRTTYRVEHPMCIRCNRLTEVVDHIVPTWVAPHLFYEPTNHQPMCFSCNRLKADEDMHTYRGQAASMREIPPGVVLP